MSDTPPPQNPGPGTLPAPSGRRLALAAVGLGALAAGAAAWLGTSGRSPQPAQSGGAALGDDFWQRSFDTPDGKPLRLASLRGQALLLNFWASWCPPCVREMPLLERFAREFGGSGWRVVGLAVDNAQPVRDFLAHQPVSFAIGIAGFSGSDLARQLGNSAGALPFSCVLDATGSLRFRRLGETNWAELSGWAQALASISR